MTSATMVEVEVEVDVSFASAVEVEVEVDGSVASAVEVEVDVVEVSEARLRPGRVLQVYPDKHSPTPIQRVN